MKQLIGRVAAILLCFLLCTQLNAQIITTIAGTGTGGFSGDGWMASAAQINHSFGVAVDGAGNIFISDGGNNRIRKILPSGIITTIAGTGVAGFSGDGGSAATALLDSPGVIAVDINGNIYIADAGAFSPQPRVRKINTSGIITTIAGNGIVGSTGDGGPATDAEFDGISGIAIDNSGNVLIADFNNARIRKVSTSGIITTIAGTGIPGFSGDGGAATAAQLNGANGVAIDNSGNIYIVDANNYRIRKVNTSGIITTVAGNGTAAVSGDGGAATAASISVPYNISVDDSGNVFYPEYGNNTVRKINASGIITTIAGNGTAGFAGDGGPAIAAALNGPTATASDDSGNLYIADLKNYRIRKVSKTSATAVYSMVAGLSNVSIYPNPATNVLFITTPEPSGSICLRDIAGRTTLEKNVSDTLTYFNIKGIARGVYFVVWRNATGEKQVQKIVVE